MKPMPTKVKAFIRRAGVCRIATAQPDGSPFANPVCHVFDGDFVYIDVGLKGKTATAIRKNPRIAIVIDDYADDWGKLRGVTLQTKAKVARGEAKKKAWRLIRRKFPQSRDYEWNPRLTLALTITDWQQWGLT